MMVAEALGKAAHQAFAHDVDAFNEVIVSDDFLHGKRGGTGDGVRLISMPVNRSQDPR